MSQILFKRAGEMRRKLRTRAKVVGTAARPRLSVKITNRHVIAQIVDDATGRTLASVTSLGAKLKPTLSVKAEWVGAEIAKKAKTAKVKQVTFDRGSRRYHGRVKLLAEAARKEGLEF